MVHCTYHVMLTMLFLPMILSQVQDTSSLHLKVSTTACQQNCIIYDKRQTCPANIYVNGRQMSPTQDGFNVLVINVTTGETTSDYFRWFRSSYASEREEFREWFSKLKNGSIVVVTLQNMCYYFDQNWHTYLKEGGLIISNAPVHHHNIAIVVGCKSWCPTNVKNVPFTYFGQDAPEFSTALSIQLKSTKAGVQLEPRKTKNSVEGPNNATVIIGVLVGVLLVIIFIFIAYTRHKRVPILWRNRSEEKDNNVEEHLAKKCLETDEIVQTPIYEVLVLKDSDRHLDITLVPSSESETKETQIQNNEHIYEDIRPNILIPNNNSHHEHGKMRDAENEYYDKNNVILSAAHVER